MEDLQGGTLALEHRYDVERRTSSFALVTAYQGTQHPFDRPVWVKVCEAPHAHGSPALYERLKRSIVDAAAFRHPRVAEVVDFGDIDIHLPFWVIERHEGTTLEEYVDKRGTLAPEEAFEIALRVAEIVSAAHAAGVVHGGLSPRWITVADDGVWLDHFGVQPTMHEIRALDGVILAQDLLWSLAPEQFADNEVVQDEAQDVWALGVLLYWMLSGVHPYLDDPTDTSDAVLRLRSKSAPGSLEELGFEPRIAAFVDRALASDPEDRFPSLRAFIDAAPGMQTARGEDDDVPEEPSRLPLDDSARPTSGPRQGGVGTALAAALLVLLLTNLGWFYYTTAQEPAGPSSELSEGAPSVLPVGVELSLVPDDASILRVDGASEVEYGDPPLTLDPKATPEEALPLVLRRRGHRDVRLDVTRKDDGHRITIHLPPDGEQAKTE